MQRPHAWRAWGLSRFIEEIFLASRGLSPHTIQQRRLPHDRRCKPQRIRRTFASFIESAGGDATEALGHSCRRVTLESYIDPTVVRKPPPNRLLPPLEPPKAG